MGSDSIARCIYPFSVWISPFLVGFATFFDWICSFLAVFAPFLSRFVRQAATLWKGMLFADKTHLLVPQPGTCFTFPMGEGECRWYLGEMRNSQFSCPLVPNFSPTSPLPTFHLCAHPPSAHRASLGQFSCRNTPWCVCEPSGPQAGGWAPSGFFT